MTARAKKNEPPPDPALVEIARALARRLAREDHERETAENMDNPKPARSADGS